jgi:hypothetical protein
MGEQRWVKNCHCENTTATRGRLVMTQRNLPNDRVSMTMTLHSEPVCDKCDTPWRGEQREQEVERGA